MNIQSTQTASVYHIVGVGIDPMAHLLRQEIIDGEIFLRRTVSVLDFRQERRRRDSDNCP
jgi:hypothetical protein